MSAESARAFTRRFREDEAFRHHLARAESPAERQVLIAEAGYELVREDLAVIVASLGTVELSDDELADIVGGAGPEIYLPGTHYASYFFGA